MTNVKTKPIAIEPPYKWQNYHGFWISDMYCTRYKLDQWLQDNAVGDNSQWQVSTVECPHSNGQVLLIVMNNDEMAWKFEAEFSDGLLTFDDIMR